MLQSELDNVYIENDKTGDRTKAKKEQILVKWIPAFKSEFGSGFADPGGSKAKRS